LTLYDSAGRGTGSSRLSLNILLRSESRLGTELPDFFTMQLPNGGPTPCFPMIVIMDNGKMNTLGKIGYGAVMGHRNPLLCTVGRTVGRTVGHTAFYLFYRWNIAGEPPPYFRRRQLWYDLYLTGEDSTKRISYKTQLD
jgi:hypothetical protein